MSALGQLTALSLIRAAMVSRRVIVPLNVVGAIINNQQRDLDMCNHLFDRGFAGLDVAVAEKCFGRVDDHFGFPEWQKFNLVPLAACNQAAALRSKLLVQIGTEQGPFVTLGISMYRP